MRRVHIIGGKNHGKTTLLCELVAEFDRRGLQVGTIKHTHHQHELDTPGKDSHRHRDSGAAVVGILSRSMNAVFWPNFPTDKTDDPVGDDTRYAAFSPGFRDCDLVLVEGDTRTTAPKIEVWRASLDTPSISERLTDVLAIVSDDPIESPIPVLPRSDVSVVADFLWKAIGESPD
ncbi:MAG: molybdopterin-guanine dinucleotide biosynthesis protein B [Planctomycetaceae bacterium]|nr:molybdopterin-guanine dinucleotide biosynthesis protein B [Planctomycetaceae bacterium]